MKKRLMGLCMVFVLTAALLSGCSSTKETSGSDTQKTTDTAGTETETTASDTTQKADDTKASDNSGIVIGSVIMNTSGEWFAEVIKGQEDAAKDLGVEFKIVSSDNEVSKESDNVSAFVAQGVNAICISPLSSDASVAAIEAADAAGIPVVNWNTTVNSEVPKGFVGVSNYDLGKLTGEYAADYIAKNFPDGCKMAILVNSSYEVGVERCQGFKDAVANVAGLEIVAEQDAELQEEGLDITEQILTANPDIDVLWAWNQTSLLGAVAALENAGRKDIVVMGTDMSVDLAKDMLESDVQLQAITTQQPYEIGYQAVANAVKAAKGETVEKETLIDLYTYTKEKPDEIQKYIDEHADLVK